MGCVVVGVMLAAATVAEGHAGWRTPGVIIPPVSRFAGTVKYDQEPSCTIKNNNM
jgi:hypothetical protein